MILLVCAIWFCSLYFEYIILDKCRWLGEFITKRPVLSLFWSLGLSFCIGVPFGAGGVMIMIGALLSTATARFMYPIIANKKLFHAVGRMKQKKLDLVEAYVRNRDLIWARLEAIWMITCWILRIVWFPFKLLFQLLDKWAAKQGVTP